MRHLTYFGIAGLLVFFLVGWLTLASQNSDAKLVENDIIQAFFRCCFNFRVAEISPCGTWGTASTLVISLVSIFG